MSTLTLPRDRIRTSGNSAELDCWIPAAYYDPDFAKRTEQELKRLEELPANWDGQGAAPIHPQILQAARQLAGDLPPNLTRVPRVVPLANGSLQFEWHEGSRSLELEIETPETIHYLKWHPEEGVEDEDTYPIARLDRTTTLLRWFQRGVVNV